MRSAPPVRWVCAPQRGWIALQVALYALAAAVFAAWVAAAIELNPAAQIFWVLSGASLAVLLARHGLRGAAAELNWTGQDWTLQPDGGRAEAGHPDLMVDLGRWMLLRFRPDRAAAASCVGCWLAVSAGGRTAAWSTLRAALYSAAPQPPLASASAERQPD